MWRNADGSEGFFAQDEKGHIVERTVPDHRTFNRAGSRHIVFRVEYDYGGIRDVNGFDRIESARNELRDHEDIREIAASMRRIHHAPPFVTEFIAGHSAEYKGVVPLSIYADGNLYALKEKYWVERCDGIIWGNGMYPVLVAEYDLATAGRVCPCPFCHEAVCGMLTWERGNLFVKCDHCAVAFEFFKDFSPDRHFRFIPDIVKTEYERYKMWSARELCQHDIDLAGRVIASPFREEPPRITFDLRKMSEIQRTLMPRRRVA